MSSDTPPPARSATYSARSVRMGASLAAAPCGLLGAEELLHPSGAAAPRARRAATAKWRVERIIMHGPG
jgi:hypothetical protein